MINNSTGSRTMAGLLTCLLCAALTLPVAASAQTNPEEDTATEPDNNAEPVQDNEPEPAAQGSDQDGSPSDYKSSEKISEDLSVSFPVDI
jgi:hypothetical protein